jgi:hypothetical protein
MQFVSSCVTIFLSGNMYANIHIARKRDNSAYILRVRLRTGDTAFYVKHDHFYLD